VRVVPMVRVVPVVRRRGSWGGEVRAATVVRT
jgi:hypothetical protein